ncbi:MAG: V-type ATP synthase subunit E [Firmicutes bacterium]|nr:V-type ATP synthase subunit E [Bacillota bacterium]
MGLDNILSKIESDARAEAGRIESEAAKQAREILEAAEARGKALAAGILNVARTAAEEQRKRLLTLAGLDARRHDLDVKQGFIRKAFEQAEALLAGIPDEEYRPMIKKMLLEAVKTGDEEVIISEKDRSRITPSLISEVNRDLASSGREGNLRISPVTREMLGGFILVDGNIETNSSFDVALRLKRDDLEPEVAAILFGESAGPRG